MSAGITGLSGQSKALAVGSPKLLPFRSCWARHLQVDWESMAAEGIVESQLVHQMVPTQAQLNHVVFVSADKG